MTDVILRMSKKDFNTLLPFGLKAGIDLNDFKLELVNKHKMDETEYLLSSEANRRELLEAIEDIKEGRKLVKMKYVNGEFVEDK